MEFGQPGLDGFQVVASSQLTDDVRASAVAAGAAVEFVGQAEAFQGQRWGGGGGGNRKGFHGRWRQ